MSTICKLRALTIFFLFSIPHIASAAMRPSLNVGLVGWWTLDGKDMVQNVADKSGVVPANNGFMSGFTSTSSAQVAGKMGQGLRFDGVNDYVKINSTLGITGYPFTISSWVKTTSPSTATNVVFTFAKSDSSIVRKGLCIYLGKACLNLASTIRVSGDTSVNDGKWHHVVGVFASNTSKFLYVDGASDMDEYTTSSLFDAGIDRSSIGVEWDSSPAAWMDGSLDDVRIYSRALSASEVKQLYLLGSAKVNAPETGPKLTINSGLAAHWTFDGKDMVFNVADKSGSAPANNGYLSGFTSTSSAQVAGKLGQGLKFDGVNDKVTMGGVTVTAPFSLSMWVRPSSSYTSATAGLISDATATYEVLFLPDSGKYKFQGYWDGYQGSTATLINPNVWSQYTLSVAANGTATMYVNGVQDANAGGTFTGPGTFTVLGSEPSANRYTGSLDEVRIYTRALSAADVKELYVLGGTKLNNTRTGPQFSINSGLVGHWTFDGKDMIQNVADRSGTVPANNGYMVGFTSTSTATVPGKLGQGLRFDGSNDYVSVPHNTSLATDNQITISMWVKLLWAPANSNNSVFEKGNGDNDYRIRFGTAIGSTSLIQILTNNGSNNLASLSTLTIGKWYHVVFTGNSSGLRVYINGTQNNSNTTAFVSDTTNTENIGLGAGRDGTNLSNIVLDDFRVYSRALSVAEIRHLYNIGR